MKTYTDRGVFIGNSKQGFKLSTIVQAENEVAEILQTKKA